MSKGEKKGYSLKVARGLVPHMYDKNSQRYLAGAWKHWRPHEQRELMRAMGAV